MVLWRLLFAGGTLLLERRLLKPVAALEPVEPLEIVVERGTKTFDPRLAQWFVWDSRVSMWRADAMHYAATCKILREANEIVLDDAHGSYWVDWRPTGNVRSGELPPPLTLRPEQRAAIVAWETTQRGCLVMPTGSGKTAIALEIMGRLGLPTLVVAPLLNLVHQWRERLQEAFACEIGILGEGRCDLRPLTVATYASAALHMERWGGHFDLLVFDECHHLSGPMRADAARMCTAARRLGLTATWPTSTSVHDLLEAMIGPVVFSIGLHALKGKSLASYEVVRIVVPLTPSERARYDQASRQIRTLALRDAVTYPGVRQKSVRWQNMRLRPAWARASIARLQQEQRTIEQLAEAKIGLLVELVRMHSESPALIFTNSNDVAIELSRRLLVPALLGHCGATERSKILANFALGVYPAVIANRVLDEGIDIPSAKVAIVVGGSSSPRQATQRLGRLLRRTGSARAVLYELVAERTGDERQSRRRRACDAYQGTRHRRI